MAISLNEPRPVDVRRVEQGPAEPGVLSATYTTTLEAARPTTIAVVVPAPGQRPNPPVVVATVAETTTTTVEPPPPPSSTAESTTSSPPPRDENCDPSYATSGPCVPRRFPRGVWRLCDWLHDQGTTRIEVVGRDRHHLDRDRDGIACEPVD
ncbi:excalibur calcium-binding domain-containing protein [Saccharothrix sp. HUAS TT1]|uniref:excalibur calcium-binding domain-containing protein n=1 Tax=unclassified Saccharothrix TaxID=2593673 RepID=UPI00345C58D1